ncbi:MYND-type domain-containing protein [Plasmodiophora brassicae]|nr:hypothetical protein PBRA_008510 [Plasmodiophora brassicae]
MSLRLNPLSCARGVKYQCEMCGQAASLACAHCRVTYYCSKQHQSLDWNGIHERICSIMAPIRNPPEALNNEDERRRRQLTLTMNRHALIELTRAEASKLLVQGQAELAIPAALQSLKVAIDVFGKGHLSLVPSYLLLAEANMGLRRFQQAEEFLQMANWAIYKNPDSSAHLRSPLRRLFGRIYLAQGRYNDALEQLAHDVYYSSVSHGPEHYKTAGGYFQMGMAFLKKDEIEKCLAFLDKVVDIWYKFLTGLRSTIAGARDKASEGHPVSSITDVLDDAEIGDAADVLRSIIDTRIEFLGNQHIAVGEVSYVLGVLCHLTGHVEKAAHLYETALRIYEVHVGADHNLTIDIQTSLNEITAPTTPSALNAM